VTHTVRRYNKITMRHSLVILTLLLCLPFVSVQAQNDDPPPDARVIQMDTRLRLRDAPSFSSGTIGFIDPDAPLSLIGRTTDSNWLYVRTLDKLDGWSNAAYISVNINLADLPITTDLSALPHPVLIVGKVADNVRAIYQHGQELGNHADVFSKVGDSITVAPHMLHPIGEGLYNLGDYQYLQSVIDRFSATAIGEGNSFTNTSMAAGSGWTTDAVLKSKYADPTLCLPDESALLCEYRVVKPSYALIMFGTNDVAHLTVKTYAYNMGLIVKTSIEHGIIPIISTIPVRLGYEQQVAEFNQALAKVARRYNVPLWEFNGAMQSLPDLGLSPDGVHPSIPPKGYKGAADFRANNLYYGYVIRNLTALQMLDAVVLTIDDKK
jgi:hypothetical protein